LLKTKANPGDEQARFECQAGTMYAIIFVHRKVWAGASHGIGHMLGPLGKVAHGETSAILLPAVCRYNAKHGGADVLARQQQVVDRLWRIDVA
jgi:alcohol dehydrogenase class IV